MFLVNRNTLTQALTKACKIAKPRATIDALRYTRITGTSDALLLACTDLELSFQTYVPILDGEAHEASVCIDPHTMQKVIRALPRSASELRMDISKAGLTVESTTMKPGVDESDFPTLPSHAKEKCSSFALPEDFSQRLKHVLPTVSTEAVRYALTGVFFDFRNGQLVTSDGRRLHATSLQGSANIRSVIVPPRALDITNPVEILVPADEKKPLVFLKGPDGVVSERTVEGSFPDYRAVVPSKFTTQAVVDRGEMLQCLSEVLSVVDERNATCTLSFNHALNVSAKNGESTYAKELDAAREGKPVTIVFNPEYLRHAFQSFKADQVLLSMNDGKSAAMIATAEDPGWAVLMPLDLDQA